MRGGCAIPARAIDDTVFKVLDILVFDDYEPCGKPAVETHWGVPMCANHSDAFIAFQSKLPTGVVLDDEDIPMENLDEL